MASTTSRHSGRFPLSLGMTLLLLVLLQAGALLYLWQIWPARNENSSLTAPALNQIAALGRLQPAGGVIPVFGPAGDRIYKLFADQGAEVPLNKSLAKLASWDDRDQQYKLEEQLVQDAKNRQTQLMDAGTKRLAALEGERQQLLALRPNDDTAQQAKIDLLTSQHKFALEQVNRYRRLGQDALRDTAEELKQALRTEEQVDSELKAAKAIKDKTDATYRENLRTIVLKKIALEAEQSEAVSQISVPAAKIRRDIASRGREDANIKAPIAGKVLKINHRDGDTIGSSPILLLADVANMIAVAEVYETDLPRLLQWLAGGQGPVRATITRPHIFVKGNTGQSAELNGTVPDKSWISGMIARNQEFDLNPRADADRRIVAVRIKLDEQSIKRAADYVGLQVDITLEPPASSPAGGEPPDRLMSAFGLALANLRSHPWRTLVSVLGVSGAVVLVFMQLGFLGSVQRTATLLYDRLDFDLLLVSEDYLELSRPHELARARIAQVQALPEVRSIVPISMGVGVWRDPRRQEENFGRSWIISILGVPPADLYRLFRRDGASVFRSPAELAEAQANLARLDTVLIDRLSRPEFGGSTELRPGASQDLRFNGKRIEIVGEFQVGTGFSYNGLVIASETTFDHYTGRSPDRVTFGLIKLAPALSAQQARTRLAEMLPADVKLLTRDELTRQESRFWVEETSVGLFFRVGVWIALLVGGIFVSQVMSSDILKQLPEYATVKALGYPPSFLYAVVLFQALLLSLSGYLPGLMLALGCYELTWQVARLPIQMTFDRAGLVLLLSIAMCLVAGLVAILKLNQADPADLFQ